jgi:hypothetical protein
LPAAACAEGRSEQQEVRRLDHPVHLGRAVEREMSDSWDIIVSAIGCYGSVRRIWVPRVTNGASDPSIGEGEDGDEAPCRC